jgi:CarD family transcriptional regulator
MYSVGDLVVYGSVGVCKVEAIGVPALSAIDETRSYYTLTPLYKDGRIYAPTDTCTFVRPVISRDAAISLIKRMPFIDASIYETKHIGLLKEHYQGLLHSHDCADLVHLIKSVYVKRQSLAENKKSLGQVEAQYMKRAEEMLYDELAVALDLPRGEVKGYIEAAVERIVRRASTAVEGEPAFSEAQQAC